MKKILTLFAGLLMLVNFSFAQVITFDKSFDSFFQDNLVDVVQTSDGGYAAIGSTRGFSLSPGIANIYIRKYNQFGDTLWTRAIGGADWLNPGSIEQTSDGGYVICGQNIYTAKQAFIAKLNANGSIAWQKLVGNGNGNGNGWDWFSAAKQNPDGSFVAVGSTRRSNNADSTTYAYLVKFDSTGNTIWEKTFGQGIAKQYIGQGLEILNGGYLITANNFSQNGNYESLLIKTDGQGVKQWVKNYPQFEAKSGKQTSDGGFIIAGAINSTSPTLINKSALFKLNALGDTVWTKKYPGLGASSVVQTTDGGYAFTGSIFADTILYGSWPFYFQNLLAVKTDGSGTMRFMRTYGDTIDDAGYSIKQTADGGFIIAGVKDWVFAVGVGPLQPGPDKGLLLKFNFTAQDEVLSVPEALKEKAVFQMYPNPADNKVNITLSAEKSLSVAYQIRLTNMLGEEVLNKKLKTPELTFEKGNMRPGLYLVQLMDSETGKILAVKKLILR